MFRAKQMLMVLGLAAAVHADEPLPEPAQLRQRVIENEKRSEELKERYLCNVAEESAELTGTGAVKHSNSRTYERFYYHGREIDRLLAKDGKALSAGEEKKEQERVDREIKKYSDPKQMRKVQDQEERQLDLFFKALRFENGRRERRGGRKTVIYTLSGDPAFHAHSIEQRLAKSLLGQIAVDEETGELVEISVHTGQDVKIAGGMLANLHKGFQLRVAQTRQPDGVWLLSLVEGTGDVRAGLFFHPRFRFKQQTGQCRLYSVNATSGNTRQENEAPK